MNIRPLSSRELREEAVYLQREAFGLMLVLREFGNGELGRQVQPAISAPPPSTVLAGRTPHSAASLPQVS